MEILNQWRQAKAVNGDVVQVKVVPLNRKQNTVDGFIWVPVGEEVLLESGETVPMNLDGASFYIGQNQLFRLR
ncbi:transposase [Acinetobacter sp.]|uniref:transposase n=1 Tax=Acinetobacter sp. TaxID=472 RepID=UPI0035AF01BA